MSALYKHIPLLAALVISIQSPNAMGLSYLGESGEIINSNFAAGVAPQFKFSGGGGTDFSVFGDLRMSDSLSGRASLSTGDTDFLGTASLKYVPFPDLESQPAIGGKLTLGFVNDNGGSGTVLRVEPIVSKKFKIDEWNITPYGALPVTWIAGIKGRGQAGAQLIAGSEVMKTSWRNWHLGSELGLQAKDSETYLLVYFKFLFDELEKRK